MTKTIRVIALYHDSDTIIDHTLDILAQTPGFEITIALPEGQTPSNETSHCQHATIKPIHGKVSIGAARSLRKLIKSIGADVVFAVSTSALSTALIATKFMNVKVVGYRGTGARVHRFDPTYRMALLNRRVAHIICETKDIENYLSTYIPGDKLSTKTKPYDPAWVSQALANPLTANADGTIIAGRRPEADETPLRLVYVGITVGRPHKGLSHLINAVNILNDRGIATQLTVVGEASKEDMDAAADNVIFTGTRRDALHFLPSAHVFVLPSIRDASPRVVREAQACGLPCIVSDIIGARDLIIPDGEQQSGILVAPGDATAIADAIATLSADRKLLKRLSDNALPNIINNYKIDEYVKYYAQLFGSLVTKK